MGFFYFLAIFIYSVLCVIDDCSFGLNTADVSEIDASTEESKSTKSLPAGQPADRDNQDERALGPKLSFALTDLELTKGFEEE